MKLTLYEEVALNGKRDGNIYHNRHSFVIGMFWYVFLLLLRLCYIMWKMFNF